MFAFPSYVQPDARACGPTCLWLISLFYGKKYNLEDILEQTNTNKDGTTLLNISNMAEKLGFSTYGAKLEFNQIQSITLPCIAFWNPKHYIVIYKLKKDFVYVSDPAHGLLKYSKEEFIHNWADQSGAGVVLITEPTHSFYIDKPQTGIRTHKNAMWDFLWKYLAPHKKSYAYIFLALLAASLIQLTFPFLTQRIVDVGIKNKSIADIYLILLAQLTLLFSKIFVDVFREYIMNKLSSKINIAMINDFFSKLMRLPISYFDRKMTGDIMQRIYDNQRVEQFLNSNSLRTLFSGISFIVFSGVLAWYNTSVFFIFIIGSIAYVYWIVHFLKRKEELDYKIFKLSGQNQGKILEMINGMQELKLSNAERKKRWEWLDVQDRLLKVNLKSLNVSQVQNSGSNIINELKNIIITFFSAKLVIDGNITLGVMLSISYILGQLNAPVLDLVNFLQQWQSARLSLARLSQIHDRTDEESETYSTFNPGDIHISKLSFKYDNKKEIFRSVDLEIPLNKTTAIIGASGCGKTTLLKLLLKFYPPTTGQITIGTTNINKISPREWRKHCGAVMQDGYIFSDTLANNIAIGDEDINIDSLKYAVRMARVDEFSEKLPFGLDTKIGPEGINLSSGQKQRVLIARVIYKNPKYLFFDEATNALDTENERIIYQNLKDFCIEKTVVIIAHRLSTVKEADQIIVLNNGEIIERGNHETLFSLRGSYYKLVKNQLEIEV